jgi:toxin ParE1/3/4
MSHRLAPEAEADLDEIWVHLARASSSLEVADRFIDSLTSRFFLLTQNPYLGRRRDQDLRPGLRSFLAENYVIVYRIEDDDVLILRVLHGNRDIVSLYRP